jgi:hypothetical protein
MYEKPMCQPDQTLLCLLALSFASLQDKLGCLFFRLQDVSQLQELSQHAAIIKMFDLNVSSGPRHWGCNPYLYHVPVSLAVQLPGVDNELLAACVRGFAIKLEDLITSAI